MRLRLHRVPPSSHPDAKRPYRMRLSGRHNPNHVLRDCHSLVAGDDCCVKFIPTDEDNTAASARTTVDDACRAQIEARLATRPEPEAVAVCRICKGLTRKTPLQVQRNLKYMRLAEQPEEIVWHLRCWCVRTSPAQTKNCNLTILRARVAMGRSSRRGIFFLSTLDVCGRSRCILESLMGCIFW